MRCEIKISSIEKASNSVAGPPTAVAVTPDGRYALVVETFKPRPPGDAQTQTFAKDREFNKTGFLRRMY